jgi:hypothetical protein
VKAKIAAYSILSGIMICGLVIFLHVTEIKTITPWEFVGALLLSPVAGLSIWFQYDWCPAQMRKIIEKAERDWNEP